MCGIVAVFAYGAQAAPVDPAELRRIRDQMHRRGPDGTGEWIAPDGRVGMGHRRLSIIDLRSIADQPMLYPEADLALVFNGEIYNYQELRAELEAQGHRFRTTSDTEVILHLYARHGAALVNRLRGMFTIALWDGRRRGMLLARDPLGIKPLYYADDGGTLRIASQVKALLASGVIDDEREPAAQAGFFLWGYVPEPYSLYAGIRAVPAGTTIWVDADGAGAPRPFFDIAAVLDAAPVGLDAAQRRTLLHDVLADTVRAHQIADVPVGVFLSAGLDSATIAALATEGGAANLNTLTLGFREFAGTENDETALAEGLAKQRGTAHQTRWVTAAEFASERAALMAAMDQPSIDGVNTYFVAKAARDSGLKVAMSGLGGDEIFAGYPSYRQIPEMVRWLRPVARIPGLGCAVRTVTGPLIARMTSPKYAGLLEFGGDYGGAYLLRRGLFMPWELPELMEPEVAREGWRRLQPIAGYDALPAGRLRVTALEMTRYMRDQLLRDADWAGMAHSIEIRVPFVDAHLLARLAPLLASGTPPSKGDMADTPAVPLPVEIRRRAKTGFVVPVRQWLMGERGSTERGLRGWAREVWRAQMADAA